MKYIASNLLVFFLFISTTLAQSGRAGSYIIEDVTMPEHLDAETGGVAFFPDGRLVACFTRGEVMTYNPETKEWKMFADGLHEPLGLLVESNSEIIVLQRPELTRIRDTDNDGIADRYDKISDSFGISGNYHEFNYGPVKDKDGNYYIALNTASSGGGFRANPRGELNLMGRDSTTGKKQMYSVVPYRGWVLKITPDGKTIPFASGFRSPNGIGFDDQENLFVTDNQSDWVETSTFSHVQEGKFYGHPASLVWDQKMKGINPFQLPIETLAQLRMRPAVYFPHGIMANSPAEPLYISSDQRFGPFAGQFLVGEMNHERIVRVMLEKVKGEFQGACVPFYDKKGIHFGNNRLAFAPDGSLYIGQITHGWLGAKGLQRIVYTGKIPMEIAAMKVTKKGFELTFTQPVENSNAIQKSDIALRHYYYKYQKKPFTEHIDKSNQSDIQEVEISHVTFSKDRKKMMVQLPELKAGYVYEFKLNGIRGKQGEVLENNLICYTLNNLLP